MKRILAFTLLLCMLLMVGCGNTDGETQPATQPQDTAPPTEVSAEATTEEITEAATAVSTEEVTEPAAEQPQTVVVCLLEEVAFFDSGNTVYTYDENFNVKTVEDYDIEGNLLYTTYYEDLDANGMPCKIRSEWYDGTIYSKTLTYTAAGKLESKQEDGQNYSGYQYAYDQAGNLIERREYYDGMLQQTVCLQYNGNTLTGVYCEDVAGDKIYEGRVENGCIVEKIFPSEYDPCTYVYQYDESGNLSSQGMMVDGEMIPSATYKYRAVEVPVERAAYLIEQQRELQPII